MVRVVATARDITLFIRMKQWRKVAAREPPLTARSVVASTLLGTHPPELPVRALVRSAALFGISEGTTRVAISRMLAAGELEATDGRYRLTGHLLERQARQERSRSPQLRPWNGQWCTAVVTAGGRTPGERAALRSAMAATRMAELREGVWLRPDNLDVPRHPHCEWFASRPEGDPGALAGRLWDLDAWASRAEELRRAMAGGEAALRAGEPDALAPGFVLSAAVLRHFQADPLLPQELLPPGWPGEALRREYAVYDAAFREVWRQWVRAPA
jgi:phenylacetic acid degradation operon negative regulatory protein